MGYMDTCSHAKQYSLWTSKAKCFHGKEGDKNVRFACILKLKTI